ncbi:GNAT family N-acetyltransferase [Microbacterium sp. TNHR37B]|uniref:GNAT family N-acetyltransferase n=1 Tax=Microbacterium sp. TNHR37B TaxID=1775956 RepID=UPI0007B29C01|nr:GNAT family N-acetyltransferase [Microbacterium sp. TNHR37B]KZE91786.1 hypothetical protein AVP41_01333 [Microbacterium sp. TNHR37B]
MDPARYEIRPLRRDELEGAGFDALVWRAAEVDAEARARIVRDELTTMTVWGAVERDGTILAFAAFDAKPTLVHLEYIATSERAEGRGIGRALVQLLRTRTPGSTIHAETDDDAVGFYRRLGFTISPRAGRDPRWPDRQRYDCDLPAELDRTGGRPA